MKSYAPEVIADDSEKFCDTVRRFATESEARQYGVDLSMRWTLIRDIRVVESDEPVNCKLLSDGSGKRISVKEEE